MINGLYFGSARLPCFQPEGKWQALMWWLVSATEAGVLSSCIRFLPNWCDSRHRKHIFIQILFLKYVFTEPLNYIWLTIALESSRFPPTRSRAPESQELLELTETAWLVWAGGCTCGLLLRLGDGTSCLLLSWLPPVQLQQSWEKGGAHLMPEPKQGLCSSLLVFECTQFHTAAVSHEL